MDGDRATVDDPDEVQAVSETGYTRDSIATAHVRVPSLRGRPVAGAGACRRTPCRAAPRTAASATTRAGRLAVDRGIDRRRGASSASARVGVGERGGRPATPIVAGLHDSPAESRSPVPGSRCDQRARVHNEGPGHPARQNVCLGDQPLHGQAWGPPRSTLNMASWGRGMTTRLTSNPAASASAAPAVTPASTSETWPVKVT